ncbi:MAG: hypothetical protein GX660_19410 [Clostridiaceae bacterium]|nr:hypothetical protein [Clostridiaceae bacterium]
MKTKRFLTILFFIIVGHMQLLSQNITADNLRCTLFDFLISKGDYDKDMKTEGVLLIINEISSLEKFDKQEIGIFKFGTLTSHSCFHIFFKDKEGFTIIDMRQPYENIVPLFLEYFQRNQNYTKEEVLNYIKDITELYKINQGVVPWKLDE